MQHVIQQHHDELVKCSCVFKHFPTSTSKYRRGHILLFKSILIIWHTTLWRQSLNVLPIHNLRPFSENCCLWRLLSLEKVGGCLSYNTPEDYLWSKLWRHFLRCTAWLALVKWFLPISIDYTFILVLSTRRCGKLPKHTRSSIVCSHWLGFWPYYLSVMSLYCFSSSGCQAAKKVRSDSTTCEVIINALYNVS